MGIGFHELFNGNCFWKLTAVDVTDQQSNNYLVNNNRFFNFQGDSPLYFTKPSSNVYIEYVIFESVSSTNQSSCILDDLGYSCIQKSICCKNCCSLVKAHYCYITLQHVQDSHNYAEYISILNCNRQNTKPDVIHTMNGTIELKYINSTSNSVFETAFVYISQGVDTSTISYSNCLINNYQANGVVSVIADTSFFSINFVNNICQSGYLLSEQENNVLFSSCVFLGNNANSFSPYSVTFQLCSFDNNGFQPGQPSIEFSGTKPLYLYEDCLLQYIFNVCSNVKCINHSFVMFFLQLMFS